MTTTTPTHTPPVTLERARVLKPDQTVPSPCVSVCKMDPVNGWCTGCFRTLDELRGWGQAPDATKLAVWARVEQRQGL
jgi:predicted Fe-S protein YdhL (DUF1289 family)